MNVSSYMRDQVQYRHADLDWPLLAGAKRRIGSQTQSGAQRLSSDGVARGWAMEDKMLPLRACAHTDSNSSSCYQFKGELNLALPAVHQKSCNLRLPSAPLHHLHESRHHFRYTNVTTMAVSSVSLAAQLPSINTSRRTGILLEKQKNVYTALTCKYERYSETCSGIAPRVSRTGSLFSATYPPFPSCISAVSAGRNTRGSPVIILAAGKIKRKD
ncbi:hypothetical protein ACQKWADRAFT_298501 [Trichoderma austrokoningii]